MRLDIDAAPIDSAAAKRRRPSQRGGFYRVAILSRAPFLGGAEVAAERLGRGLVAAGHEVLMVVGVEGDTAERVREAGLPCVVSDLPQRDRRRPLRYLRAVGRLRRILRRFSPDIVHANDLPTHQITAHAARSLAATRVCHHRYIYDGEAIRWLLSAGVERHLFVSKGLRDELETRCPDLRDQPGAVTHDGLELPPRVTPADRCDARQRLALPHNSQIVCFAGQIVQRKGVADLLRAWSSIYPESARDTPSPELIILGDDPAPDRRYRIEMQKLACELGIEPRFIGFRNDVPDWLTAADISVTPSHAEPLGNAVLEAMAHSLPVIGGDVGGIPEMIAHDRTGLLVPPHAPHALAAALNALMIDTDRRRDMGQAGRERCERRFTLEAHTAAVLEQYNVATNGCSSDGGRREVRKAAA